MSLPTRPVAPTTRIMTTPSGTAANAGIPPLAVCSSATPGLQCISVSRGSGIVNASGPAGKGGTAHGMSAARPAAHPLPLSRPLSLHSPTRPVLQPVSRRPDRPLPG